MTEIKVHDLNDAGLDWAVAICEKVSITGMGPNGRLHVSYCSPLSSSQTYSPSHDHWTGDQIIEREDIVVSEDEVLGGYKAVKTPSGNMTSVVTATGPTSLIAAMRCYVSYTLGPTIQVPDELAKPLLNPLSGPWGV